MLSDSSATFNEISSAFRRKEGEPDFVFQAFDLIAESLNKPFSIRSHKLFEYIKKNTNSRIQMVMQYLIRNKKELTRFEKNCLTQGYEGVIIRDPNGPYKCGRSTIKEGYLLKIKRFQDSEAEIIGFVEQLHNNNPKEKNELGLNKRATKKEYMVPTKRLGALVVKNIKTGVEFEIGTGFTRKIRTDIWKNKDNYLGEIVKYKHQTVGADKKPRFPVWLGFRGKEDM